MEVLYALLAVVIVGVIIYFTLFNKNTNESQQDKELQKYTERYIELTGHNPSAEPTQLAIIKIAVNTIEASKDNKQE